MERGLFLQHMGYRLGLFGLGAVFFLIGFRIFPLDTFDGLLVAFLLPWFLVFMVPWLVRGVRDWRMHRKQLPLVHACLDRLERVSDAVVRHYAKAAPDLRVSVWECLVEGTIRGLPVAWVVDHGPEGIREVRVDVELSLPLIPERVLLSPTSVSKAMSGRGREDFALNCSAASMDDAFNESHHLSVRSGAAEGAEETAAALSPAVTSFVVRNRRPGHDLWLSRDKLVLRVESRNLRQDWWNSPESFVTLWNYVASLVDDAAMSGLRPDDEGRA